MIFKRLRETVPQIVAGLFFVHRTLSYFRELPGVKSFKIWTMKNVRNKYSTQKWRNVLLRKEMNNDSSIVMIFREIYS